MTFREPLPAAPGKAAIPANGKNCARFPSPGMTAVEFMTENKPYRPNVGIALFNASGQVLIGRRFRDDGPEIILPGLEWQMPQGGIDAEENPRDTVMRELWEETGVVNAAYLGETDWLSYDFPPYAGPSSHRLARFRGYPS